MLGSPSVSRGMHATWASACLLTGELFLNHFAIRTVAANLNNDLAKLINSEMAGQLRREEWECFLQFKSSVQTTCRQITV